MRGGQCLAALANDELQVSDGDSGGSCQGGDSGTFRTVAATRLFSDVLSRSLAFGRLWFEEQHRAFVATSYYEALAAGGGTGPSFRDRGSKARRVFDNIYAGR